MSELYQKTATELSALLKEGEISSVDIVKSLNARRNATDSRIQAFISCDEAFALKQAEESDKRRKEGKSLGVMDGVPVGMKDILATKDQPLTCASKILQNYVSPYDGTCSKNLKKAGVVQYGRLNMDEFAMGSSTEHSAFHSTFNPWNLECSPGGSSGGSAASVAARQVPVSLGTDTGGSIRQPAALTGIYGMKPTYGRVSRYGLVAFASSLDQIGPFGRTAEDVALLLGAIAGHDAEHDSTSINEPVPNYAGEMKKDGKKFRIGIPKEYFIDGIEPEVLAAVKNAISFYEKQGYAIEEVSMPNTEYAVSVYYIIASAEASSNLARYDGIRYGYRSKNITNAIDIFSKSRAEGFGEEVKRRIILGTYVLSSGYYDAYYLKAQKVRTLVRNDFLEAFKKVDALLTPTTPTVAFKMGSKTNDPLQMYLNDIFTINVNLAGLPGMSVPAGFDKNQMPIGFQLIGKPFGEVELLQLAHQFEQAHQFHTAEPKL
jgi:aspartyl-tRNA(Asn)/glutamyl-tRNA(Gln) amidotransferase subunit A